MLPHFTAYLILSQILFTKFTFRKPGLSWCPDVNKARRYRAKTGTWLSMAKAKLLA